MNRKLLFVAAICSATIAGPALAGEIKGPPPSTNYTAPEIDMSFSLVLRVLRALTIHRLAIRILAIPAALRNPLAPSSQAKALRSLTWIPRSTVCDARAVGCNPNRGVDLHGGG